MLLTQRSECERQGITRRARHWLPKAGQNTCRGESNTAAGGPNSGQAPPNRCREQELRGRHDCNGREEGTQHRERENIGVLKTGRYASRSGGAVQAQAVRLYIPTDERVLSRQLLLPCRRRRADSAQVLQQVKVKGKEWGRCPYRPPADQCLILRGTPGAGTAERPWFERVVREH